MQSFMAEQPRQWEHEKTDLTVSIHSLQDAQRSECLCSSFILDFMQFEIPAQGMDSLQLSWVYPHLDFILIKISLIKIIPHGHIQRPISWVILALIKMISNNSHHNSFAMD